MWMEEPIGKRINVERMDEAAATGADVVGVACPFCMVMLDDGAKDKGTDIEIKDVSQVMAESLGLGRKAARRPAGTTAEPS
jgi:Fe-S oxidoreductase